MGEERRKRLVTAPLSLRLVLPSGWFSLSTAADRRDADIKTLLDRQFTGLARDELIDLRVQIDQRMRRDLGRAALAGATQVHALVDPVAGLPISATLIVAELLTDSSGGVDTALRSLLGEAKGVVENGPVVLTGRDALRRRRRAEAPMSDDPDAPVVWHTHVDYVVQAAPDRLLVLSFVTSTDEVADQMVFVFDAIAATLHGADDDVELAWEPQRYTSGDQSQGE